jgi:hypothetical protein
MGVKPGFLTHLAQDLFDRQGRRMGDKLILDRMGEKAGDSTHLAGTGVDRKKLA